MSHGKRKRAFDTEGTSDNVTEDVLLRALLGGSSITRKKL